jgi:RES domain-containing protein
VHSIERMKTALRSATLVSYSGYSYRVIEDRWRNDPLSAIGALQNGGRYNSKKAGEMGISLSEIDLTQPTINDLQAIAD